MMGGASSRSRAESNTKIYPSDSDPHPVRRFLPVHSYLENPHIGTIVALGLGGWWLVRVVTPVRMNLNLKFPYPE